MAMAREENSKFCIAVRPGVIHKGRPHGGEGMAQCKQKQTGKEGRLLLNFCGRPL